MLNSILLQTVRIFHCCGLLPVMPLPHFFSLSAYNHVLSFWSVPMAHPPCNHSKERRINTLPISLKERSLSRTVSISGISSFKLSTSLLLFLPVMDSGAILVWPICIKPCKIGGFFYLHWLLFYFSISVCNFIDEKTQGGTGFMFRKALCVSECSGFTILT